jgi:hypothetical protein
MSTLAAHATGRNIAPSEAKFGETDLRYGSMCAVGYERHVESHDTNIES